jgi:hypothetical protein
MQTLTKNGFFSSIPTPIGPILGTRFRSLAIDRRSGAESTSRELGSLGLGRSSAKLRAFVVGVVAPDQNPHLISQASRRIGAGTRGSGSARTR